VPLENRVTWPDLGLRGVVIFVDHSRDGGFSAYGSQADHITDRLHLDARWPLETGLMRPVPVVVGQVLAENQGQVAFAEDQEPVQELTAECSDDAFAAGQRGLLTEEQFGGLSEAKQREYLRLMGADRLQEMAAMTEEASEDEKRQYLVSVALSPVFEASRQQFLGEALSQTPFDARIVALEDMKQILDPEIHANVIVATFNQLLQVDMDPMDRARRLTALLPHLADLLTDYDQLIDLAFQLPGPPTGDDESLCTELVDVALRDFGKVLRDDPRFGQLRHNTAARLIERDLSDQERETITKHRGPRVHLLSQIAPLLSGAGLEQTVNRLLKLPAAERADGIAALMDSVPDDLRERLRAALFELESPFARFWALFNSQERLADDHDPALSRLARTTAESFTRPRNAAGCLVMLIGYADDRPSWIRRVMDLAETLPAAGRLEVLAIVTRMADGPVLIRMVLDSIHALPTPDLVYKALLMLSRVNFDMATVTADDRRQLRAAASRRLRSEAQRGRAELLRTLAGERHAFTSLSTPDGVYATARAVQDVCIEWQWPSRA
jgi:hypothetical protein